MCEVCECLDKGQDYVVRGDWTDLAIEKDNKQYKIFAYGEGVASMCINYCPMCRKRVERS